MPNYFPGFMPPVLWRARTQAQQRLCCSKKLQDAHMYAGLYVRSGNKSPPFWDEEHERDGYTAISQIWQTRSLSQVSIARDVALRVVINCMCLSTSGVQTALFSTQLGRPKGRDLPCPHTQQQHAVDTNCAYNDRHGRLLR